MHEYGRNTLTFLIFSMIFLSTFPSRSFLFTIRSEGCLLEHSIRLIDIDLFYVRRPSCPGVWYFVLSCFEREKLEKSRTSNLIPKKELESNYELY